MTETISVKAPIFPTFSTLLFHPALNKHFPTKIVQAPEISYLHKVAILLISVFVHGCTDMLARLRDSEGFEASVKPQFREVTLLIACLTPGCVTHQNPQRCVAWIRVGNSIVPLFLIKRIVHSAPSKSQSHLGHHSQKLPLCRLKSPPRRLPA